MANSPTQSSPVNYFVITTNGRIYRADKLPETQKVNIYLPDPDAPDEGDEAENEIRNLFPDRETAYMTRDRIVEAIPTFFLEDSVFTSEPEAEEGAPKTKTRNYTQEAFQKLAREKVFQYNAAFWNSFLKLKPKDMCDIYIKMARYGFAQAPNLKALDEEGQRRVNDRKAADIAEAIRQGIPTTDTDFEEEDD